MVIMILYHKPETSELCQHMQSMFTKLQFNVRVRNELSQLKRSDFKKVEKIFLLDFAMKADTSAPNRTAYRHMRGKDIFCFFDSVPFNENHWTTAPYQGMKYLYQKGKLNIKAILSQNKCQHYQWTEPIEKVEINWPFEPHSINAPEGDFDSVSFIHPIKSDIVGLNGHLKFVELKSRKDLHRSAYFIEPRTISPKTYNYDILHAIQAERGIIAPGSKEGTFKFVGIDEDIIEKMNSMVFFNTTEDNVYQLKEHDYVTTYNGLRRVME